MAGPLYERGEAGRQEVGPGTKRGERPASSPDAPCLGGPALLAFHAIPAKGELFGKTSQPSFQFRVFETKVCQSTKKDREEGFPVLLAVYFRFFPQPEQQEQSLPPQQVRPAFLSR